MLEREVEKKLIVAAKARHGIALKFTSPGFRGVPDRLVLLPDGRMAFVELKAPGKKPTELQLARHELLRDLGFRVFVIDRFAQVEEVLDAI